MVLQKDILSGKTTRRGTPSPESEPCPETEDSAIRSIPSGPDIGRLAIGRNSDLLVKVSRDDVRISLNPRYLGRDHIENGQLSFVVAERTERQVFAGDVQVGLRDLDLDGRLGDVGPCRRDSQRQVVDLLSLGILGRAESGLRINS